MARIRIDRGDFERKMQRALQKVMERFSKRLSDDAPFDTGELQGSIDANVPKGVRKEGRQWVLQFKMAPQGLFVEKGTKPHIIRPKNKKVLKFEPGKKARLEAQGKRKKGQRVKVPKKIVVFTKEVHHPGTKAQPFIEPNFRKHFVNDLEQALSEVFK